MSIIHVTGKRWFSRTYGNTYNSATIYIDGRQVAYLDMKYGYGEYYLQRAQAWLVENGYLPSDTGHLRINCENNGHKFTYECVDVARQKDL